MASSSFRSYVSYRLELVSKITCDVADSIYRNEFGLNIRELRVLRSMVEQPDITASEIVEITMFDRTLVSRMLTGLVRAGLVARRVCDIDARQIRISATAKGSELVARADEIGDRLNEDLLSALTKAERESFDKCLSKIVDWAPSESFMAAAKVRTTDHDKYPETTS